MQKISLIFVISFIAINSYSQIGGISASKLATVCTSPVAPKKIEFEPSFSVNRNPKYWNDRHIAVAENNISNSGSFGFRFTYGVMKNLETGFSLPSDASSLQWGLKYRFYNADLISFAFISGANFDFHTDTMLSELGVGAVTTLQYTKNFSTDIDIHLIDGVHQRGVFNQFILGIDNGFYIGYIQYILGINYFYRILANTSISNNLYLSPGVTIEPAKNFLMVLSFPISVYGTNDMKDYGFSFALTITID